MARYVVGILEGAKPREPPIDCLVRYSLAIGPRAVGHLGLTVSHSSPVQADRAIERPELANRDPPRPGPTDP